MAKIVRHEFIGSPIIFFALCLSLVGIPFAILYMIAGTVTVEEDIEDPTQFLMQYRARKHRG